MILIYGLIPPSAGRNMVKETISVENKDHFIQKYLVLEAWLFEDADVKLNSNRDTHSTFYE